MQPDQGPCPWIRSYSDKEPVHLPPVVGADSVVKKRRSAIGRVVAPAGIGIERIETVGGVITTGRVAFERLITGGGVVVGLVEIERVHAGRGIVAPA